jgi:hypothetical protein
MEGLFAALVTRGSAAAFEAESGGLRPFSAALLALALARPKASSSPAGRLLPLGAGTVPAPPARARPPVDRSSSSSAPVLCLAVGHYGPSEHLLRQGRSRGHGIGRGLAYLHAFAWNTGYWLLPCSPAPSFRGAAACGGHRGSRPYTLPCVLSAATGCRCTDSSSRLFRPSPVWGAELEVAVASAAVRSSRPPCRRGAGRRAELRGDFTTCGRTCGRSWPGGDRPVVLQECRGGRRARRPGGSDAVLLRPQDDRRSAERRCDRARVPMGQGQADTEVQPAACCGGIPPISSSGCTPSVRNAGIRPRWCFPTTRWRRRS